MIYRITFNVDCSPHPSYSTCHTITKLTGDTSAYQAEKAMRVVERFSDNPFQSTAQTPSLPQHLPRPPSDSPLPVSPRSNR